MPEELIYFGSAVKALGDGRVGGYLVEFTDYEAQKGTPPDLVKEFFTKSTDYDIEPGEKRSVYFDHGQDPVMKRRRLGKAELKTDDVGLWAETILDTRDKYLAKIYELAEQGKLGWSSGSAPHLVEKAKKSDGFVEITAWPIAEASLTHRPCNPFSAAIPMKAFVEELAEAKGEKPAAKAVDGERLFTESLRQTEQQTWELWSAVQTGARKIVEAALAKDVTGVDVDVRQAVTALVGAYAPKLTEAIVSQITDYLGAEVRDEHFYLKSAFDSLNEDAPARFLDHLEVVLAAAREVNQRAKSIQELRVKAGRVISTANRTRLSSLLEMCRTVASDIEALLAESEPKPQTEKAVDAETVNALLAEFESLTFRQTVSTGV